MELKRVYLCLCVFLCHTVVALATHDTCPDGYRWYSMEFSCVRFSESASQSFSTAQSDCGSGDLVLIGTEFDRVILQRYLEVFTEGSSDSLYWVGYQYDATPTLLGVDGQPAAEVVTNTSNYDESNDVMADDGVCIAIGGDGLFRRVMCTQPLRHICQLQYMAPQITFVGSDAGRFIDDGASVTLTCEFVESNIERAVWRLNGIELPESSQSRIGSTINLTINSFDPNVDSGSYDCLVENPVGTVLSEVVLLEGNGGTSGGSVTINQLEVRYDTETETVGPVDNTAVRVIPLGVAATLRCMYDNSAATVQWYQNGEEVMEGITPDPTTSSELVITSFQEGGIYQCRVTLNTGESATERIVLRTTEGIPNAIEVGLFFAVPESQQVLFVSWLPPEVPNSHDRLLLRYQILYSTGDFDPANGSSVFLPSINSNDESVGGAVSEGIEEEVLGGLQTGTKYSLVVVASTLEEQGMEPESPVSATTYGSAPTEPVQNLTVERTPENDTIVAMWLPLETSLPEGPIARYEIQYRNAFEDDGEATPNAVAVDSRFTFVVFLNLMDADEYEVRVRASVEINRRDLPRFENTPWTEWIRAEGITTNVPPPPPTSQPVSPNGDDGRVGTITVAVIVPVLVVALMVAIVVVAVIWLHHTHKGKARLRPRDSAVELKAPEDAKPTSP